MKWPLLIGSALVSLAAAALVAFVLVTPAPTAPAVTPTVPAGNDAGAALQDQLNGLLATVLGPDKAVVSANVMLNQTQSSQQALSYGKRGTTLQSSVANASATGYKRHNASATWGHTTKLVTTAFAPGAVKRITLAVVVDAGVPAKTVKALKRELATAAGLRRSRGDRISVTTTRFPTVAAAPATPLAKLKAAL